MNEDPRTDAEENFAATSEGLQASGESLVTDNPAAEIAVEENIAAENAPAAPAEKSSRGPGAKRIASGVGVALAAWAVPGLGHLLLGRWGRALILFGAVSGLAVTGYVLRGNLFGAHPTDGFNALGFFADAGSGIFYFLAHRLEAAGPDVSRAAGDYGTRFLAAAGVVNWLCALDAYEIATGMKE